jgi:hypothetical protein
MYVVWLALQSRSACAMHEHDFQDMLKQADQP